MTSKRKFKYATPIIANVTPKEAQAGANTIHIKSNDTLINAIFGEGVPYGSLA